MMMMKYMHWHQKTFVTCLFPFVLCFFIHVNGYAGSPDSGQEPVRNMRWMQKGDIIIIGYDLAGAPEDEYDVSVLLRDREDSTFSIIPVTVFGDVGMKQHPGNNKGIRWSYRQDIPQGLASADYYIQVNARLSSKPFNTWYYVIGGSALAAAGLLVLVAGGNQNTQPGGGELPAPPGRP